QHELHVAIGESVHVRGRTGEEDEGHSRHERRQRQPTTQLTSSNSISNFNAAFGGIFSPAPCAPYPIDAGITSCRIPPTRIPFTPSSQPSMTSCSPSVNSSGSPRSRELSNLRPSRSVPV